MKSYLKKIAALSMAALLVLSLAACGGKEEPTDAPSDEPSVSDAQNAPAPTESAAEKETQKVDPFEKLALKYSGLSGKATLKIDVSACPEYIQKCVSFTASKTASVKNGDSITVTASFDSDKLLKEYGVILTAETKAYTVSGCGDYMLSPAGANFTGLKADMKKAAADKLRGEYPAISASMLKETNSYFADTRGASFDAKYNNVIAFYAVPASALGVDDYDYLYIDVTAYDVIKNSDGSLVAARFFVEYEFEDSDMGSEIESKYMDTFTYYGAKVTKLP